MAGEVEESFSINFQAESIHSGSISFGRFESEPLSWERRSSFSHNRYLEEVEKYSKPGSVIEKKAYFEAHFKKKGLFGTIPSAGHDGPDRASSGNDGLERIGNQEDFESNDGHGVQCDQKSQEDFEPSEDGHYVEIEKRFQDDFEPYEDDHYIQFDQGEDFEPDEGSHYVKMEQRSHEDFDPNEDGHYVQIGEILVRSDYHGKCGVIGYEREDAITECPMVSFSSPQMESAMNSSNDLEDATNKSITLDEAHQSEKETSNIHSANDEAITEVKKDDYDTVNTNESSRNMSRTVNEPAEGVEKTTFRDPANPCREETKPVPGLNSEVNNVRVQKSTSSRLCKDPARNPGRESPRRTNMEKNLSKLATPTTRSVSRTAKEVSKTAQKLIRESRSEKVSTVKKAAESPSVLKTDSRGIQEADRLNRALNSTKSDIGPRAAAFNFKSSERAERRKEEKTEADIKKLRKSLNFKATPMPSFYHTTLPSQSHGNKLMYVDSPSQPQAVSSKTRSKKVQNKPKCPERGADAALPLKLKMENDQAADESVTATGSQSTLVEKCPVTNAPEASLISSATSTNQSCLSNAVTNNHTSGKKERAKTTPQKHGVSESCKGGKRQSNERNKNEETTKHKEIMRKGMRNVGLKSNSRSGNLAVRVAS